MPPPDPPPPAAGQVVLQISADKHKVPNVPVVENRLVVVAWVPVAFMKVKFWRVDDPVTKRLERVVRPLVAERVPGKT